MVIRNHISIVMKKIENLSKTNFEVGNSVNFLCNKLDDK